MFRDLKAVEIAEGALLADIAVLFQLLVVYIPVVGQAFRLLIFIVFAVLVLRRGLYVGVMGFCVALFVVMVIIGTHSVLNMILECLGGLFLGVTIKSRMPLFPLLLIGVTGGSLALYILTFVTSFIFAVPLTVLVDGLHVSYNAVISFIDAITAHLGLFSWWRHTLYPDVSLFADIGFRYWLLFFFLALWITLWPVVFSVYLFTNSFVRLLGYDVRPIPSGRIGRLLRRFNRRTVRIALKRGMLKGHRAGV